MKKWLSILLVVISVVLIGMVATDKTYLLKGLRVTYLRGNTDVTIGDFKVQATTTIKADNPEPWPLHEKYNEEDLLKEILDLHQKRKSLAFLIIKDGKLLTEQYFAEGGKDHISSTWSITKTYASILILCAVQDGLIDHIDDPVSKYIPELNFNQQNELTLRHLASMSTGLFWNEWAHTPFSKIAKLNFYSNLEKFIIEDMYETGEPGEIQLYNSGGTQILGIVLKRVLNGKTITEYLEEKIWNPLGYEHDGLFVLDSKKYANEKTYGGIVATARDVGKLGQLFLNEGKWNNQQILSENDMELIETTPYNNSTYTYGLWTGLHDGHRFYYQAGFRGQFCITYPKYNVVIVRLGHKTSPREHLEEVNPDVYDYISEALRILEAGNLINEAEVL